MKGTVKWFNRIRGYGFVTGEDDNEYFVHKSQLPEGKMLDDNDKVEFDTAETDKGLQAQNVELIQKAGEEAEETEEATSEDESKEEKEEEATSEDEEGEDEGGDEGDEESEDEE